MSAIFRAEIENLQRLVAQQAAYQAADTNERERIRTDKKRRDADDEANIIMVLRITGASMGSVEIANRTGIDRTRVDRILARLLDQKTITRRQAAVRRTDGQGFRKNYRYRIAK